MKWKDTGDMGEKEETNGEEYFDEEQYSPWTTQNLSTSSGKLGKIPMVLVLLGLAIVTSVAALLVALLLSTRGNAVTQEQVNALEHRIQQLEERLDKYEAIDEKVTRIWEQAKSFEKFKDRFDRSEASISLRMDHLTMSLEALQKQLSEVPKIETPPAVSEKESAPAKPRKDATSNPKPHYHTVVAGDTFFNISKRYDISIEELLNINHLEKDSVLQVGQKIIVGKSTGN